MSRHRVTASDLRAALDVLHELLGAVDLDQFTEIAARVMPHLLSADVGGYNEADPKRGRFVCKITPAESVSQDLFLAWAEHAHEHPHVRHVQQHARDVAVYKITDFVPQHRFRNSGLCRDVYRPMRVEYQISMPLPQPPGAALALTFNRTKDFTERDRSLLTLIQPVITQAYRNAALLTDLRKFHANRAETRIPASLTPREAQVLRCMTEGHANKQIAETLRMSVRTVEKHIEHILDKLNVRSRTAACAIALRFSTTARSAPSSLTHD